MKLTDEIIDKFCSRVLLRLRKDGELVFKVDEKEVLAAMKVSINREIKRKEEVIKEAQIILAKYESQMGEQIDRGKMLKMIKEKLFKERNIVF